MRKPTEEQTAAMMTTRRFPFEFKEHVVATSSPSVHDVGPEASYPEVHVG